MAVRAVTAKSIETTIREFDDQTSNELGRLEDLNNKIFYTPEKGNTIQKNWRTLNEDFSKRFTNENALLDISVSIRNKIGQLPEGEQGPLLAAIDKITNAFHKAAVEKQFDILQRFKLASSHLGAEKFPLSIQTSSKPGSPRALPPLDPSDVELTIGPDGKLNISVPVKKPQPSLLGRIFRALYNNSGKIAFVASAAIIASQTGIGAKVMADGATLASEYAWMGYEAIKPAAVDAAVKTAAFAKDYLPQIGSALSAVWSLPSAFSAWRSGHKKTAVAIAAAGVASGVAPHVLQAGFADKVATQAASLGLTPENLAIATHFVKDNASTVASYVGAGISGLSSIAAWRSGHKKTALALATVGIAAGAAPHVLQPGLVDKISNAASSIGLTSDNLSKAASFVKENASIEKISNAANSIGITYDNASKAASFVKENISGLGSLFSGIGALVSLRKGNTKTGLVLGGAAVGLGLAPYMPK